MDGRDEPGHDVEETLESKGLRETIAQPFIVNQSLRTSGLSFTSTQRPFWICCTWVMVLAR